MHPDPLSFWDFGLKGLDYAAFYQILSRGKLTADELVAFDIEASPTGRLPRRSLFNDWPPSLQDYSLAESRFRREESRRQTERIREAREPNYLQEISGTPLRDPSKPR